MTIEAQTSSSVQERRRTPRVAFEARIQLWTEEGGAYRATGRNLSELGMLLHTSTDRVAASDQPLRVTFRLPQVETPLQVQAEVVHIREEGRSVAIGLRFLMVTSLIRRMLRTYVAVGHGQIRDYVPSPLC
jgi:c-di-GMP-binding flagellar brake protein YcgR